MKQFTLFIIFFTLLNGVFAQEDCDFKIQYEDEEEVFLLTQERLTEYMVGKGQTVFIYFSLIFHIFVQVL